MFDIGGKHVHKMIKVTAVVISLLLSLLFFRPMLTDPNFYSGTLLELDREKTWVTSLLTASTATSLAVTAIPDDIGTPIAEQLANLSTVFIFILSVLYAEKYLLTLFGFVSTTIVFPAICICCLILILFVKRRTRMIQWIKNLVVLLIALLLVVPMGVKVSSSIYNTYRVSIESVINSAIESDIQEEIATGEENEEKNLWGQVKDIGSNIVSSIGKTATGAVDKAKQVLNHFIEATAVMLVTCCVVPLIVVWIFLSLLNKVFNKKIMPVIVKSTEVPNRMIEDVQ